MNKRNYQKELDKIIDRLEREKRVPTLFLHSCCAPCSSYVLEYLSRYFAITVFYYNPNISPSFEYETRVKEQERLTEEMNEEFKGDEKRHGIRFLKGEYHPEVFYEAVKGLEQEPEGGKRCTECFRLRLYEAARLAKEGGYDFFTTTLTISPLKDADRLNAIGEAAAEEYEVSWLNSDFKRRDGYKRSTELSAEHKLYRQNYCGCVFSKQNSRLDIGRNLL